MKLSSRSSAFPILVAVMLLPVGVIAFAQQRRNDAPKSSLSSQARKSARQAVASVALILVRNGGDDSEPRPRGSAVIVSRDGLVATNFHVIAEEKTGNIFDDIYIASTTADGVADPAKRYR